MALRKIALEGEACLSKMCRPVTDFNSRLHTLLDDLADTLADSGGVGLAAPQVGVLRRVCVVLDEEDQLIELVNPEIIYTEGEQTGLEGCLSVPGKYGVVTRPEVVRVRAQDRDGQWFEVEDEGLTARCSSVRGAYRPAHGGRGATEVAGGARRRVRDRGRRGQVMRILFMGTPDFAVASLKRLVADGHDICGVFTQPDKPKNRGMKLIAPPVKEYALTQGLHVYQPLKMKDGTALELVRSLAPELIVVAAYGRILPEDILNTPKYGAINVHSSILPKYRGAAPINWAILNGDAVTGVSIMYMAPELDAGDVILCRETAIDPDEDAVALTARLAELGAEALHEAIGQIERGTVTRTAQDHAAHTYAPMLDKSLSPMDFSRSAQQLHDQVRGLVPWPSASMVLAGKTVKVHRTAVGGETSAPAGSVVEADKNGLAIACGDGRLLRVLELQGEGGKRMAAADYLRGHPVPLGL